MMRWWWFGAAVNREDLARDLRTMKAGGIGGVEIQPVYPLELDDPQTGFHNLPFLSPEFLRMVGFAANTGHDLGMRVSITPVSYTHLDVYKRQSSTRATTTPMIAIRIRFISHQCIAGWPM